MIFSYSGASLQNSLSPGTKRNTKDGCSPRHVKRCLILETQATSRGGGSGRPRRDACPSFARLSLQTLGTPARCLPQHPFGLSLGDHSVEMPTGQGGKSGGPCRRARVRGSRWIWRLLKIKSDRKFVLWVAFYISSEALSSKSPRTCF